MRRWGPFCSWCALPRAGVCRRRLSEWWPTLRTSTQVTCRLGTQDDDEAELDYSCRYSGFTYKGRVTCECMHQDSQSTASHREELCHLLVAASGGCVQMADIGGADHACHCLGLHPALCVGDKPVGQHSGAHVLNVFGGVRKGEWLSMNEQNTAVSQQRSASQLRTAAHFTVACTRSSAVCCCLFPPKR
jgi:hypothetical protein